MSELTYAAIITLTLPGMTQPATVAVTLTPPATIQTATGQHKPLRDCTLAEVAEFADALEAELWARYGDRPLGDLVGVADTEIKITLLDDEGARRLEPDAWLEEAIVVEEAAAAGTDNDAGPPAVAEGSAVAGTGPETAPPGPETRNGEAVRQDGEAPAPVPAATDGEDEGVDEAPEQEPVPPAAEETPADEPQERESVPPDEAAVPPAQEEAAGDAPAAVGGIVAPPPEETPVVAGTEPVPAPESATDAPPATVSGAELRIAGLRRPVGHPTPAAVDILINEATFRNTQAHALTSLNREVAGMLIGPQPEKQPDGRYVVHITDAIIAKHTRMHGASVTYTPESWRYVTDVLQERYPNEEALIVGWYHTHPGFGIFLSGMDLFIHQNFFTQKWHVALVLDPLAHKSGFFCWDRGQQAVQAYDFPWPTWAAGSW